MVDPQNLILFISAALVLTIAPGPDIVYLVVQGATQGRKAGFITAMGFAFGNLVHTMAAALGLSVIFKTSPLAFNALKIVGILYLLYLAWVTLRNARKFPPINNATVVEKRAWFWRPFLMNVMNPKVILFFIAFLPQFVSPHLAPLWMQMMLFGLVFIAVVIVVFGVIGVFAGTIHVWIKHRGQSRLMQYSPWMVSAVYLYLAIHVAFVHSM